MLAAGRWTRKSLGGIQKSKNWKDSNGNEVGKKSNMGHTLEIQLSRIYHHLIIRDIGL